MVVLGTRKERLSLTCANTEGGADCWQHRLSLSWSQVAASPGRPHWAGLTGPASLGRPHWAGLTGPVSPGWSHWAGTGLVLGWPHLAGGAVGAGPPAAKLPNTMSGAEAL